MTSTNLNERRILFEKAKIERKNLVFASNVFDCPLWKSYMLWNTLNEVIVKALC